MTELLRDLMLTLVGAIAICVVAVFVEDALYPGRVEDLAIFSAGVFKGAGAGIMLTLLLRRYL